MQTARDLVAVAAELAAGVQRGHDDLGGRLAPVVGVVVDGNPATVVGDAATAVGEQHDFDLRAVAGHRLVDGVVDDLVDEMVQARRAGRSDVHARSLADGFEAFEDRDVFGAIRHAGLLSRLEALPPSPSGRGGSGWSGEASKPGAA